MARKNAFWDKIEGMREEAGIAMAEPEEEIKDEEIPDESDSLDPVPDGPEQDMVLEGETVEESLIRRYDQSMDMVTRGITDAMKAAIDLAEADPEFAPTKECMRENFSRGVVPYLEEVDGAFYKFYPEDDPRRRRVK